MCSYQGPFHDYNCQECDVAVLEPACPDCGRDIELHSSGWWSHVGMPDGCWRVSMDGPNDAR